MNAYNHSSGCLTAPLNSNVKPELLFPFAPLRENKEFKTDAPSGHGLTAALGGT
jgi:hypothetical protein